MDEKITEQIPTRAPYHSGEAHADSERPRFGLPRLVRVYFTQIAIGFGLSAAFVGLLLGFDVANLRSLMLSTQGGAIAGFLLFFFNGLVFAGVQFAITIMRMAEPTDRPPHSGLKAWTLSQRAQKIAIPVPVKEPHQPSAQADKNR
ncbi:hypothetical protein [Pararhodobacter oceanensis]|uniref:hypothetical protein n=1 Tax=Pararhodobacter oceanensis TaxID=2172121 RepID=UPI001F0BE4C2|nr:hypothetical protein [Pararhodobacter oceanensis]